MSTNPEQLLKRARTLDQNALVEIYDLYSDPLFAYAYKHLGDFQATEELVSETFFRFLGALERGGGPKEHLKAYLYRITHNLITDRFRRQPPPSLELDEERLPDDKPGPASVFSSHQDADRVRQALRLITADQRQVIVLKFLEGWSGGEIAQVMEKSLGAVKALQHRGLAALERILIGQEVPEPGESPESEV
ncbi:MAG: RNA polymerase sigma factor [Anaerolineales bacterium]